MAGQDPTQQEDAQSPHPGQGPPPPPPTTLQQELSTDREREQTRRRIAYILIGTLVVVVLGSFVYVIWMSLRAGDMTLELLISVMQTIGTTLLAPVVGLIGAVVGFYFGAQTAVQGAQAANQSTRTATQATEAVTRAVSDLGTQIAPDQPPRRPT